MPQPHPYERPGSAEVRQLFAHKLTEVQASLAELGVDYVILGGIATSSYIDDGPVPNIDFQRKYKAEPWERVPDIDIIAPKAAVSTVMDLHKKLKQDRELPLKLELIPSLTHIDFLPDQETSYLTHRELRMPVRTELFVPVTREFLGVPIRTVTPQTLLHTYVTFGGLMRAKDRVKARGLARVVRHDEAALPEAAYRPFHDFIAQRACMYPDYVRNRRARLAVVNALPDWAKFPFMGTAAQAKKLARR